MTHDPIPKKWRSRCLTIECIPLLLPFIYAAVRWGCGYLPLPQADRWPEWALPTAAALLADLLTAPLRFGRRLFYYRLAAGRDPRGSFRSAFRRAGRAWGWRTAVCLCRSALLAALLLPLHLAAGLAAKLRALAAGPAVDLALLSCHLAAAAALLLLLPLAVWLLLPLMSLAEMRADSGSLLRALSRSCRLMRGRRGQAALLLLRESRWMLLWPLPVIGLYASAERQRRLALWICRREAAVLPPMQEGVRLYIPHSGRKISSPPL